MGPSTEKSYKFFVVSDRPVFFSISSEGYAKQWIKLDNDSRGDNTIRLSKK